MYAPIVNRCSNPQSVIMMQVVPTCQLQPEELAMLEALLEDAPVAEDALAEFSEGSGTSCLSFVSCDHAAALLEALVAFERGWDLQRSQPPFAAARTGP